ncbi:Lrp/AsnC family transcriptional regulator [Candidatus Woesearchaeota archaeon]|nr:Lrp/AsnC family transcriptional regulator [Candidatus Woesearchaeota archaeon]
MDKLDLGIIETLSKNSRTPFMEIARKLKVSESTIRKRVSKLEDEGIIKKYSLVVDTNKIGIAHRALIGVDVTPEKYLDVAKKLAEFDGVKFAASTTGDHMFMLEVWTKNDDELRAVSDKLKGIDGVTRICPAIIKDTLKGAL